jgi:hypothetical protein
VQRAHEPLRKRVRPQRPDRRPDHLRAVTGEDAAEPGGETNKTYRRCSSTVSTCMKSHARIRTGARPYTEDSWSKLVEVITLDQAARAFLR